MIIALAGRRVDAIDAKEHRFSPTPESVERVRQRIRAFLISQRSVALVSSAACGADLLGQEEAGAMGLRRKIVLPSSVEKFRSSSVTDRPGDWGPLFDAVLKDVKAQGNLVIIRPKSQKAAYAEVNHRVISEAMSLAKQLKHPVTAVRIWDGKPRGDDDFTEEFGKNALGKGIPVEDILTI
ncbi:MAG: hypothetical protein ABSE96_12355 [Terracidiphilus sp.]|jgi:hypothetical protein